MVLSPETPPAKQRPQDQAACRQHPRRAGTTKLAKLKVQATDLAISKQSSPYNNESWSSAWLRWGWKGEIAAAEAEEEVYEEEEAVAVQGTSESTSYLVANVVPGTSGEAERKGVLSLLSTYRGYRRQYPWSVREKDPGLVKYLLRTPGTIKDYLKYLPTCHQRYQFLPREVPDGRMCNPVRDGMILKCNSIVVARKRILTGRRGQGEALGNTHTWWPNLACGRSLPPQVADKLKAWWLKIGFYSQRVTCKAPEWLWSHLTETQHSTQPSYVRSRKVWRGSWQAPEPGWGDLCSSALVKRLQLCKDALWCPRRLVISMPERFWRNGLGSPLESANIVKRLLEERQAFDLHAYADRLEGAYMSL